MRKNYAKVRKFSFVFVPYSKSKIYEEVLLFTGNEGSLVTGNETNLRYGKEKMKQMLFILAKMYLYTFTYVARYSQGRL